MRTVFIAFIVVLICVAYGYYQQKPEERAKLFAQVNSIYQSFAGGTSTNAATASADSGAPGAGADAPAPVKTWTAPAVIPAQANWTWATTDGKTYQNVVITKVDAQTVTITHALGVAHLPISAIPAEIQKQLNYDPELAASMAAADKAEEQREQDHPYYTMAALADAQAAARQTQRPLAWICSKLSDLTAANPDPGSEEQLTQMAMSYLKARAIIIFLDGNADLGALSPIVRDQQLFQYDDVNVPPPHHFYAPKIAFTDPDVTKALGRVSYTQMKASGETAIGNVLQSISGQ